MVFDDKTKQQIVEKFNAELKDDVYIKLFSTDLISGNNNSEYIDFTKEFLKELSEISGKIHLDFDVFLCKM
jgi:predicted HTH domain antitoxin